MIRVDPVASHAAARPDGLALVDLESGRRWTYAQLDRAVDRLAAWLCSELGPASGARVATLARNCAEMLALQLACVRAGAIFVPYILGIALTEAVAIYALVIGLLLMFIKKTG